jgi:hypothetical protein
MFRHQLFEVETTEEGYTFIRPSWVYVDRSSPVDDCKALGLNGSPYRSAYLTITPEHAVEVSRRLKDEFDNGKEYYALQGRRILVPDAPGFRPSPDQLIWHNEHKVSRMTSEAKEAFGAASHDFSEVCSVPPSHSNLRLESYGCNSSLSRCWWLWVDFCLRGSVFLPALLLSLRDCRATLRSHLLLWGPGARLPTQPLAFRRAIHAAVPLILFVAHEEGRCARWILADLQPSDVPKQPTTCFQLTGSPLFGNG